MKRPHHRLALTLAAALALTACGGGQDPAEPVALDVDAVAEGPDELRGETVSDALRTPAAGDDAESLKPWRQLPACPEAAVDAPLTDVTAVQGPGERSPLEGRTVTVRGIVTADLRAAGQQDGFYLQQALPDADPATSEGLFVYAPGSNVALSVGDHVQVRGAVAEFSRSGDSQPLTQISRPAAIEVCGAATPLRPRVISLPLAEGDTLERFEGMLVRIAQPMKVTGNYTLGRFGELQLSALARLYHPNNHPWLSPQAARSLNARSQVLLDDTRSVQNPAPVPWLSAGDATGTRRTGDVVRGVQGVLGWGFNAWRVQPTVTPEFVVRNARRELPPAVGGQLKVASLNVLNWFTTLGARGASNEAERQRQLDKLVATIVAMDADVLGLIEIENDGGRSLQALVDAVNARLGAPAYAIRDVGVPGTDQITTAVIHKPARVSAVGNLQIPDDAAFAVDGGLRVPVAQRFASTANGGGFWFVVNHFKSKGSCPAAADSVDAERGQGCWNDARTRQAQALLRWVDALTQRSGETDVLMAGDFNAYLNEDPLNVLRAAGHEALLERLPPKRRYTYQFNGEAGALDHAFASASLSRQVRGVAVWHTNADEPVFLDYNTEFKTDDRYAPTAFRASDHDPVLVGLSLSPDAVAAAPTLSATLPAAATAGEAVSVTDLVAAPSAPGAGATLSVDWGEGAGFEPVPLPVTTLSHTYAAAGRYVLRLRLAEASGQLAERIAPVSVAAAPVPVSAGLIISEYVEGSGLNKAVELHNPGPGTEDLSRYVLRLFSNGAATPTASLPLTGSLGAGGTLVIANPGFAAIVPPAAWLLAGNVINFNGDDALVLERDGAVVDQFGQVGFDPGTAWVSGALSTLDRTLRRKAGLTRGSVPPAAPAAWDLSLEWDVLPVNTVDGLGAR
jgi:predicted extracellular nuclease